MLSVETLPSKARNASVKQFIRETDLGGTLAFGLDLGYVIFKVKFTTSNIGLNYCAHGHPVRQVVARLEAVRVLQGHRGGERSTRIARSAPATPRTLTRRQCASPFN